MKTKMVYLMVCLLIISLISLFIGLYFGSTALTPHEFWLAIIQNERLNHEIILDIRWPRVINAFVTGGLLAMSGCLLQTLLNNPLADPYVLGISSGAALTTLIAIVAGLTGYALHGSTLLGGLITMFIVLRFSRQPFYQSATPLLLTGVIFAAGCNAIISLILTLSPDTSLRTMMFWLLGDFNDNPNWLAGVTILACSFGLAMCLAKPMDLLRFGELKAQSLGVHVKRLNLAIYILSAIMTATAVSLAGCIGFIGLITPHFIRLLGFYSHRIVLPASLLLGGSLVTLADALARTLIAPQQLPVGILTAVIGVPCFLFLLKKRYAKY